MTKNNSITNPAAEAAQKALALLYEAIDQNRNFVFEAGAGAGKTYSLVKALHHIIDKDGKKFLKAHKRIACISYTNVAKHQIEQRTDRHPVVHSDTIHAFCWELIGTFQTELRKIVPLLGDKWMARLREYNQLRDAEQENVRTESEGEDFRAILKDMPIIYQLGYPSISDDGLTLHHDDVLHMMIELLKFPKFQMLLTSKYPIIFIDEYQDTYSGLTSAFLQHFINPEIGPRFGFFGDHWQKIYGSSGCGKIESEKLLIIPKNANFRSVPQIVNVLNAMRPELRQEVEDTTAVGTAVVYHTNDWIGDRRTGGHWAGDLPAEHAHNYLTHVWSILEKNGWDFSPQKTKVLMLTHNVLAEEQGYRNLANIFSNNEAYIKKEDKFLAFFMDVLEPMCSAFAEKKFGEMFSILGMGKLGISSHSTKVEWADFMNNISTLRVTGTIGDIIDFMVEKGKPKLPENIAHALKKYNSYVSWKISLY